jgi:Family of unknown function (DUF6118)
MWRVARGNFDRWQAGAELMQAGNPLGSQALAAASRLMSANADAIRGCQAAVAKAGKEQKCSIVVTAP